MGVKLGLSVRGKKADRRRLKKIRPSEEAEQGRKLYNEELRRSYLHPILSYKPQKTFLGW
jgi:hypothetical protein